MKKKGQRTKLPLLAFEADSWTVDIKYRKSASNARRADKSPRTGAPRLGRTARIEIQKPTGVWAVTPGFIRDYCQ